MSDTDNPLPSTACARQAVWIHAYAYILNKNTFMFGIDDAIRYADRALADFDKRFPEGNK